MAEVKDKDKNKGDEVAEKRERRQPQDHKRSTKRPVVRTVYICNDTETADEFYDRDEELAMLKLRFAMEDEVDRTTPSPEDLKAKARFDELVPIVEDLKRQVREDALVFKFRSIGRKAYNKLVDEHQPTEQNKKDVEAEGQDPKTLRWNPETFFPALAAAACCEKPEDVDLDDIWDDNPDWNISELAQLAQAAIDANESRRLVPLGNA